jgi:Holliday junction resolvase RusA-like endonuclease
MRSISFEVLGDPKAQKRHRHGRGFTYDPSADDKADFLLLAHGHAPDKPINGPIELFVDFYMPIPKSTPKKRSIPMQAETTPHIKRPDIDNMLKFVMDALNPYWHDDAQVSFVKMRKLYSPRPRTSVSIEYQEKLNAD